jgi:hypothetical protein
MLSRPKRNRHFSGIDGFDVVEAGAVAQRVVGEVQDVVGLVVGEVELQQVESLVDGLGQAELADQQMDGADAAAGDAAGLGGDVIVDVGGGEDRLGRGGGDGPVESAADSPLAGGVVAVWNRSQPSPFSLFCTKILPTFKQPSVRDFLGGFSIDTCIGHPSTTQSGGPGEVVDDDAEARPGDSGSSNPRCGSSSGVTPMIRPQASSWSDLRRRVRHRFQASTRRRQTSFRAELEALEPLTLLASFVVSSTADSGAHTLRAAIIASNAATGQTNTISFSFAGSGVQKIALLSALPPITNPVVIDATLVTGYTSSPLVELDGTNANAGTDGLVIASSAAGTVIKGLDLHSFGGDGIDVLANNVVLSANNVGTNPAGTAAAPNHGNGIVVRGSNDTVGGLNVFKPDGSFQVRAGNLVSGNAGNGVVIAGANNLVQGNWIGVSSTGKSALGNALDGVVVEGVSSNTIGGTSVGTRNVIAGNLGQGVSIANIPAPPPTTFSTSAGPLKLTAAGIAAGFSLSNFATNFPEVGNPRILGPGGTTFPTSGGVLVTSFDGRTYKFPTDTDGQLATAVPSISAIPHPGGLVQWNGHIYMTGWATSPTADAVYEVDKTGKVIQVIANTHDGAGIVVDTAPGPLYGHLLVATNGSNAPSIYDVDPVAKTAKFVAALPGSGDGDAFDPRSNILYVAINGYGVVGYSMTSRTWVWNSGFIPGAPDGIALGVGDLRGELFVNTNGGTIVEVSLFNPSVQVVIASGGTRGDLATVDSNNGTYLVTQSDRVVRLIPAQGGSFEGGPTATTSGNVVEGNLIGLGSDGSTPVANGGNGIMVSAGATGNTIGGLLAGQGNTIGANKGNGVAIVDPGSSNNAVEENSIGTDSSGTLVAGNLGDGVWVGGGVSSDTVTNNTIANNSVDGVGMYTNVVGNTIRANRIYGNKGQGINRGTGSTGGQSIPVLTAAYGNATASYVIGTAPGTSGTMVTVDFYANITRAPSGYGQGQFYLGSTTVKAGASFQVHLPVGATPGEWVSATTTSASGATSGFAADVLVVKSLSQ